MTKQVAESWLLSEFTKFYLSEKLTPLVDLLTEQNFITEMSDFVTENKDFAETEIRNHNPDNADALIAQLNSLNYEMLKQDYFTLYNQQDPVVPNLIPQNPQGTKYMEWLNADCSTLRNYAPDIFAGGMDLNLDNTKVKIQASLDAIAEIQDDITNLKTILETINK